ncbi:hypothetical protein DV515_00011996 [Chloebia gouldiae]|uniref:Uncharacterized protein n=1 Tax=Chloebia gouldiae TaxID=44316 RepID=A0A3L8S4Y3_CHLGU|nr:hypothetical protein DV515_00011996 [Chloebia gouldiae]
MRGCCWLQFPSQSHLKVRNTAGPSHSLKVKHCSSVPEEQQTWRAPAPSTASGNSSAPPTSLHSPRAGAKDWEEHGEASWELGAVLDSSSAALCAIPLIPAPCPPQEQVIALTLMFSSFLVPTAWVLSNIYNYRSRPE